MVCAVTAIANHLSGLVACELVPKTIAVANLSRDWMARGRATCYSRLGERSGDSRSPLAGSDDQDGETSQRRLDSLERCLQQLETRDRELILEYYRGEQRSKIEGRRRLAGRLGLTVNALSIRTCRLRDKLEACVNVSFSDA